jgi:competence protein ComEC
MKGHPFVRYAAGLVTGILLYVLLPDWPIVPLSAGVIGTSLLIRGYRRYRGESVKPPQVAQGIGALLIVVALGWCITYQRTATNRPDNLVQAADTLQAAPKRIGLNWKFAGGSSTRRQRSADPPYCRTGSPSVVGSSSI